MKTQLTILRNGSSTCVRTGPEHGRQPVLAPLIRILCAAGFVLSAFAAQAGVIFTSLYSFTGTNDGANPQAALVQGSDGYLYGTTYYGGTNDDGNDGTVFRICSNGALTTLYSFGSVKDTNYFNTPLDGANPNGLVQGSDGYFYGTTQSGGTNGNEFGGFGTIFKISTNGVLTTLYSFGLAPYTYTNVTLDGAFDGSFPVAGLVQGSDGYFYGTTAGGGTNGDCGTVFRISTNGVFTSLYSFTGGNDGANPEAALVQGSDGYFYGTTGDVGGYDFGTVFKISSNGSLTTLCGFENFEGIYPSGLIQGSDGNFYGTTRDDSFFNAPLGRGYVFKITTDGAFTNLYHLGSDGGIHYGNYGINNPVAGLVQGSDGSYYGTIYDGGLDGNEYGNGTVFRLTIVPEPQLTIIPFGPYVILTWPTNSFAFTLQSSTDIGSSANWNTNSPAPVVIGGQNVVVNPITGSQMFFRLANP